MEELQSLAQSAGHVVVGKLEQVRQADPSFQIGRGKVEELTALVKEKEAEKIIFDNELRPLQAYNLATEAGVEAVDRFQLILEIFDRRAATTESKLQIDLARLRYELPRAKAKVKLAMKGEQPGFMGLGKYEVQIYYDSVRRQIHLIQGKLKTVGKKRSLHRKRRTELGYSTISLAGYTNAGKSSVFRALAKEEPRIGEGLFTTLSTTTRSINLSSKKILLTDTVGFIDRLPLTLIEAFHSTLEETVFSDLILLVVDVSEAPEEIDRKLKVCLDTIRTIGATGIPIVTVFNKIDLIPDADLKEKMSGLRDVAPNPVPVSALYGTNMLQLQSTINDYIRDFIRASFTIPLQSQHASFISWLHSKAHVLNMEYEGEDVHVDFESVPWFADKVRERVKELGGTFEKA